MAVKTTVYLTEDLKMAIEQEAKRSSTSEAEVIRRALATGLQRPRPRPGIIRGEPFADHADDLMAGFGDR